MMQTDHSPSLSLRALLPPVVLGMVLRVVWVLWVPHRIIWDEASFNSIAVRLAEGGAYGLPFWPPGWPTLISAVYRLAGPEPRAVLLLNALLSTLLLVAFGHWTARQFDGRTAHLAVWIMALSPSYLLAAGLMIYETLLQLLLVTALLFGLRPRWSWGQAAALGALCAAITLIRPTWIVLPLLVWGVAWLNGARIAASRLAAAQALAVLLVVPWVAYASAAADRFVPIAMQGGLHLWMANHAEATGTHVVPPGEFYDPVNEAIARAEALDWLRAHPLHPLRLLPAKLYYSFRGEAWSAWVFTSAEPPLAPAVQEGIRLPTEAVYWAMMALAMAGVGVALARRERRLLAPLAVFLVLMAAQVALFTGQLKHRWPLNFILIAYAALALLWGVARLRRGSPSEQLAASLPAPERIHPA